MTNKIGFEQHGYDVQLQEYKNKLELEKVIAPELKAKLESTFR